MTKLWIVVEEFPYEGYGLPLGIFSSFENAEKCRLSLQRPDGYVKAEIVDYELDV